MRIFILFFFLLLPPFLSADEEIQDKLSQTKETQLLLPLPLRLEENWWDSYQKSTLEILENKINLLKEQLILLKKSQQAALVINKTLPLIETYFNKRSMPFSLADAPIFENKPSYHLEDLTEIINLTTITQSKLQLLNSSTQSLATELKKQQQSLLTIKKAYQKKLDNEQIKLIQGLTWIKQQFRIALLDINKQQLKRQIKAKERYLNRLKKHHQTIFSKLTLSLSRLEKARQTVADVEQKLHQKSIELSALKKQEHAIDTRDDNAILKQQVFNLRSLRKEVDIKIIETNHLNASLVLALYQLKFEQKAPTKEIRLFYKTTEQRIQQLKKWLDKTQIHLKKEERAFQEIQKNTLLTFTTSKGIRAIDYLHISLKNLTKALSEQNILLHLFQEKLEKKTKKSTVLIEKADATLKQSWHKIRRWMTASLFTINDTAVTTNSILRLCLIFFMGWLISRIICHSIDKVNQYSGMRPASIKTLHRIIGFAVMSITLLIAFSNIGLDVTKFTLFASALSIGIGFGLQNIINNFVSGIILMFEQSMRVADYVELSTGLRGTVKEINIRSTVINTNDNIDIIVPNSEFVNNSITNWTMKDRTMRIRTNFGVAYGTDKERMRDLIIEAISALPYTLTSPESKKPQVRLINFGDSSLDFQLVVWIKPEWMGRPGGVRSAYNWEIETVLAENNIVIPFPQRDVRVIESSSNPEKT